MRGKAAARRDRRGLHGITPAYAGKRARSPPPPSGRWDHPRVCGEKSMMSRVLLFMVGSPPRMRGKVRAAPLGAGDAGITPACAGKRGEGQGGPAGLWDHPRVCGEKKSAHAVRFHSVGSPPRVRGKAVIMGNLVQGKGITPACAGKSKCSSPDCSRSKDHPRVCGEKGSFPKKVYC